MFLFFHLSPCFTICRCFLDKSIFLFLNFSNFLLLRWQVSSTRKHSQPVDFASMPSKALDQVCLAIFIKQLSFFLALTLMVQAVPGLLKHYKGWGWNQVGRQANHTLADSKLGYTEFKKSWSSSHFNVFNIFSLYRSSYTQSYLEKYMSYEIYFAPPRLF